jgi:hypothetical protein
VPIPPGPICAGVACVVPPGGCSCVNHMCTRGILTQGQSCVASQDACSNGLKCCPSCATPQCVQTPVCVQIMVRPDGTLGCPLIP